jgi:phosphoglycerate dehydrogenase-like enzyme
MPAPVLIFSPDAQEAERYGELLRAAIGDADLTVASSAEDTESAIGRAEVLFGWKFPAGLLARAPALRWIHKISAGVEDVVLAEKLPASVRLTRTDGAALAPRMIEYVLCAIYMTTHSFPRALRQQGRKLWQNYLVDKAQGKVVGVAGLGDIGGAIAQALAKNGMRVLGWRRSHGGSVPGIERIFAGRGELERFVSGCDFVVSVLPTTAETKNVFSSGVFSAMRSHAVFINVGRGASVDEDALAEALKRGTIGGAVLDVFREEPLPASSPLWDMPQVIITPHVSGPIVPEDVVGLFIDNFRRYRAGEPLLREVDIQRGY